MSTEQSLAAIRGIIYAVNAQDFVALRNAALPDFKRHDLAGALSEVTGFTGVADLIQLLLRAMPDMHIDIKQIFATDDRVAAHIAAAGTHQGELFGVPGTGRRLEVNGVNLYRVADGKLAETWQLLDVWGLMRQLGKV
ncbi:MAG: ester cyclase [Chloroflexi bacterium]|nr:ester cyclase [Chloroflexota bacterium]